MPRVTEQHRAARRDQILAAAVRCVAREGFHKTTMADVIREADLSAGAVYLYFRGKDDIIRALAERSIGRVAHVLVAMQEQQPVVRPEDALQAALEELLSTAGEAADDLLRVGVQAWGEALRDEAVHATVSTQLRRLRQTMADLVRRAQAEGLVSKQADADSAAALLCGAIPGFILQRLVLGDLTPASYVDGLRGLVSPAGR